MKRLLSVLAFVLLATQAWAQDVDFGAFGDAGSLLGPSRAAAAPARGGAAAPNVPPPDRLLRLRDALAKAEAPMTKEQEVELNKLLDTEIPAMQRTLKAHGQEMLAARAASAPPAAAVPAPAPAPPAGAAGTPNAALLAAAMAARGAPPSSRVPAEVLDALEVEMRQMNDALFTKIASSPALDAKQQAVLTKMSRSQIRARGGYDALRISMEDAGAPFTEEQIPQVKALFEEQKKSREVLAKETQGTPDPAKLKQLETETLTKVVRLLVPAQRTALLAVLRGQ